MNCQQAQMILSLYLYGELEFAEEELFDEHVASCAFCQRSLDREKEWHSRLNAEKVDVSLEFLSDCRQNLKTAIASGTREGSLRALVSRRWRELFTFAANQMSVRLAAASFLVFIGFTVGRWADRLGLPSDLQSGGASEMGLVNPYMAHVRDIQPDANDRIHIVFDQVREREITGRVDDDRVRQLLLAATKDPTDPGIRVDSVEILKDQNGSDVRDALLYSARHDSNSAVRLKAVEGLRRFIDDPSTQGTLKFVLEHDDNPAIRSEAIDILAPSSGPVQFSPDLENTLHEIMRYESSDDYVRSRCLQILREMKASLDVY